MAGVLVPNRFAYEIHMPSELWGKFPPPCSCLTGLYNEHFVPLPAQVSTSWKSHSFLLWLLGCSGQGSRRTRLQLPWFWHWGMCTLASCPTHSLMLNSPFQSFNRFLGEEEVEAEVSLFACVPAQLDWHLAPSLPFRQMVLFSVTQRQTHTRTEHKPLQP